MMIHDGIHESHKYMTWDYEYAVEQTMRYLNGREDDLVFAYYFQVDNEIIEKRWYSKDLVGEIQISDLVRYVYHLLVLGEEGNEVCVILLELQ